MQCSSLIVRCITSVKMDSKIKTGPFGIFLNLCKKLDIMKIVKPIIEECYSINLREWKHIVRERVWKNENSNWIIISGMSRTLGAIKMYEKRNVFNTWWNYVHKRPAEVAKCKNMLKIVLNCHYLKACKSRYCCDISSKCDYCYNVDETIEHILFECPTNRETRTIYWKNVENECPKGLLDSLNSMSCFNKAAFLISGLGNAFVSEWMILYERIIDFVNTLYIQRLKLNEKND